MFHGGDGGVKSSAVVAGIATRPPAVFAGRDVDGRVGDVYEILAKVRQRKKKKEMGKKWHGSSLAWLSPLTIVELVVTIKAWRRSLVSCRWLQRSEESSGV